MRPTLTLLVGLPGAGKTTRARSIEHERRAVRLTPDEWMIPLFGESDAGGKRDILEGRLISLALVLLRRSVDVVLDFGCWSRAERTSLRALAAGHGGRFELVYLPIDRATQLERIASRWSSAAAETFPMTEADVDRWRKLFEEPDAAELSGPVEDAPPVPFPDWTAWAVARWPSLSVAPLGDQSPTDVVRRHLEAFSSGDLAGTIDALADDAQFRTGHTTVPPAEFAEFFGWAIRELHPGIEIETLMAEGRHVACCFIETIGSDRLDRAAFYEVEGGRITSADVYDRRD